jgi:hypothetical protein
VDRRDAPTGTTHERFGRAIRIPAEGRRPAPQRRQLAPETRRMLDHPDPNCKTLYTDPTSATYPPLQRAFDHFDRLLLQNRLPRCLLTLRNHGKAHGYFSARRFATADGEESDEIALNPRDIRTRPLIDVLSTVVHEMVHLDQHHFGQPSRNGYHNRQ